MKKIIEDEQLIEFSESVNEFFARRFKITKMIARFLWFPFKGYNFLFTLSFVFFAVYVALTFFVMNDYIKAQYGSYEKMLCSASVDKTLRESVVRVVGGTSEGSGFFITNNQVLTNFHVIEGEPSPKIIFPDGSFITPTKISGNKEFDLAILHTEFFYSNKRLNMLERFDISANETLISAGYPLGTDLTGVSTVMRGKFLDYRKIGGEQNQYIQTDISLISGMSGGPLTDLCGNVVGINTMGMAGQSLFIPADVAWKKIPEFSDQEIVKIEYKPEESPAEAVRAFYNYLKARKMDEGYGLLSESYKVNADYREWNNRFSDVIDVEVVSVKKVEKKEDLVYVKFITKNWGEGYVTDHYYQGTWKTVREEDTYKMLQSNIEEIEEPGYEWFFEEE